MTYIYVIKVLYVLLNRLLCVSSDQSALKFEWLFECFTPLVVGVLWGSRFLYISGYCRWNCEKKTGGPKQLITLNGTCALPQHKLLYVYVT